MKKSGVWKAVGTLTVLLLLAGAISARTTSPASGQKKASAHSSAQSSKTANSKSRRPSKKRQASSRRNWRRRGQQAIKQDRAREIQTALIRERYLTGEPTGVWDERTKKALAQYQSDHSWQTKNLPDARALIQLGLGPTHEGLLNPESVASTERPSAAPPATAIAAPR